jgi:hypothetical protein
MSYTSTFSIASTAASASDLVGLIPIGLLVAPVAAALIPPMLFAAA